MLDMFEIEDMPIQASTLISLGVLPKQASQPYDKSIPPKRRARPLDQWRWAQILAVIETVRRHVSPPFRLTRATNGCLGK
jgi:hypothetical protein